MNKQESLVVGIGEVLWDCLPSGKQLGGAPANFAYHSSQFGLLGLLISAVGNDPLGKELIETLTARDISSAMQTVAYPTGRVDVTLDEKGVPQYEIATESAWDHISYTPLLEQIAQRTSAVCFGSLAQRSPQSKDSIYKFIDHVSLNPDALIIFDINLRQNFWDKNIIVDSLQRCNILKINDEELSIIQEIFEYKNLNIEQTCQSLMKDYDIKIIILTCGAEGSYVTTSEGTHFKPTPQTKVADTVGAGDSFTATFIAALLKGNDTQTAHEAAIRTSAYVCSQHGAMPQLPPHIININN